MAVLGAKAVGLLVEAIVVINARRLVEQVGQVGRVEQLVGGYADQFLGFIAEQVAGGLRGVKEGAVAGVARDQVGGAFGQPLVVAFLCVKLGGLCFELLPSSFESGIAGFEFGDPCFEVGIARRQVRFAVAGHQRAGSTRPPSEALRRNQPAMLARGRRVGSTSWGTCSERKQAKLPASGRTRATSRSGSSTAKIAISPPPSAGQSGLR